MVDDTASRPTPPKPAPAPLEADGQAAAAPGRSKPGAGAMIDDERRYEAKVRRAFIRDGRLTAIPAQDRKRQVILRWLVETCFAEDRVYPEAEVNMRLALIHPDVAALRRHLVDAMLMTRSSGEYRRPVSPPARRS